MITVACVLVHGNVPYSMEYVARLRASVKRYLPVAHRFVCLTDWPKSSLPADVDHIKIHHDPSMAGWWAKMQLFNPQHELRGRVLYLDLDTLVVDWLEPIVEYDAPFALAPDAGKWQGTKELKVVKRYNSSVMVWDNRSAVHKLFSLWTPNHARRLWGDQDFIGQMLPNEAVMPLMWFPRLSEVVEQMSNERDPSLYSCAEAMSFMVERRARVVLSKKPKNQRACELYPWFGEAWRR